MKLATELRSGAVVRLEGELYRVVQVDYHAGGGKMHGVVHAKLQNLLKAQVVERRLRPDERLEELTLERQTMEYLYDDAELCTFMHPETYEQVSLPQESLGPFLRFVKVGQTVQVDFLEGSPIGVVYPATVDLKVETAPEPLHTQHDSNVFKTVTLENGMEVLVPQFIKTGDTVRVEVETGKYLERV